MSKEITVSETISITDVPVELAVNPRKSPGVFPFQKNDLRRESFEKAKALELDRPSSSGANPGLHATRGTFSSSVSLNRRRKRSLLTAWLGLLQWLGPLALAAFLFWVAMNTPFGKIESWLPQRKPAMEAAPGFDLQSLEAEMPPDLEQAKKSAQELREEMELLKNYQKDQLSIESR